MNELTCQEFVELVTDFMEDELDEHTTTRFKSHLMACDGCVAYFAQFQQTVDALGGLPAEPLPSASRSALLEAFRRTQALG